MEKIVEELRNKQNIRANLSNLRQLIKDGKNCRKLQQIVAKDDGMWLHFLDNEDAKSRKNAALLLGDIAYEPAVEALWNAYEKEQTLFVRSSYLDALSNLDTEIYVPRYQARIQELEQTEVTEENRKHTQEELHALRKLVIQYEGISRHTFALRKPQKVILVTNRIHREVVRRALGNVASAMHPLGVSFTCDSMDQIQQLRIYRELLFPLDTSEYLPQDAALAAQGVWNGGILPLLRRLHEGDGAFYFRVECKSPMALSERSVFCRKFAAQLEQLSGGQLINSTNDYEIEIRLIATGDDKWFPCVKCYTCRDTRFAYRKNAIATSIHPSTAALIMELSKPYLKDGAQVLDPFCGVGTMLVERHAVGQTGDMYATDIFGDAITMGRENAKRAGMDIHFIHRDFFDFSHDYLFDEVITDMPVRGRKTKEELEHLYEAFFQKVQTHLKPDGIVIMYTNEIGFVKKQLRLHKQFTLLQETLMQTKGEFYLLILGLKG